MKKNLEQCYIIGLSVRTTNENGQSATDIPLLWHRFMSEGIAAKIPNKAAEEIYSVYTDYELDHTRPYTTLLGCRVTDLNHVPEGMTAKVIEGGEYLELTAKGKLSDNIIFAEWQKIWASDLPRTYQSDFEVYGPKSQNPDDAEVNIYLSIS